MLRGFWYIEYVGIIFGHVENFTHQSDCKSIQVILKKIYRPTATARVYGTYTKSSTVFKPIRMQIVSMMQYDVIHHYTYSINQGKLQMYIGPLYKYVEYRVRFRDEMYM